MTFPRLLFLHPVCTVPGPGPARWGGRDPCGVGRGLCRGRQGFREHWSDFCLLKDVIQAASVLYLIPKSLSIKSVWMQCRAAGWNFIGGTVVASPVAWCRQGRLTRVCVCALTAPGVGRRPAPVPHAQSCRALGKCPAGEEVTLSRERGRPQRSSLRAAQPPCAVRWAF